MRRSQLEAVALALYGANLMFCLTILYLNVVARDLETGLMVLGFQFVTLLAQGVCLRLAKEAA